MFENRPKSYYTASANASPAYPKLIGDHHCDVCIVGGGMTGTSAALDLAERGYKVMLIEGRQFGWGASGRSGGQAIIGYNREPSEIRKFVGAADAEKLWQLGQDAMDLLRKRVQQHNIQCDLTDGYYHVASKARQDRELAEMLDEYETVGYHGCSLHHGEDLRQRIASPRYTSALHDPHSGHLHPLNYTLGLAAAAAGAGAHLHENTPALSIRPGNKPQVKIPGGAITCDHVILCANAYIEDLDVAIGDTIMPVGTYIVATEPLGEDRAREIISDNAAVADLNFVLNYYRFSADHRMLFGGRVSYSTIAPVNIHHAMGKTMVEYFPQLAGCKIDFAWGGNVAITVNRLPHFGRAGKNIYFAHGFSGHGVALTGLAGKLMAEAVAGSSERFDVFARIPHRKFPGGKALRTPVLVLAMAYYRLLDLL
jgi:gamma-glutamylputrescine oxidase